jgi:hypothetical protein
VFRSGAWQLLECRAAWDGNPTAEDFVAFAWTRGDERRLVAVNYSAHQSQCYVNLPWGGKMRLRDQMGTAVYDREGSELYLDMPAWGYHVFEVSSTISTCDTKRTAGGR